MLDAMPMWMSVVYHPMAVVYVPSALVDFTLVVLDCFEDMTPILSLAEQTRTSCVTTEF